MVKKQIEMPQPTYDMSQGTAFWDRMQVIFQIMPELYGIKDLDILCRRIVELARQKLGAERCSLFLLNEQDNRIYGTYGTDLHGNTTDEHHFSWDFTEDQHPQIRRESFWYVVPDEPASDETEQPARNWVAYTWMTQSPDTTALLCNDAAISNSPPDLDLQQIIAVYFSIVYGLIRRLKIEQALHMSEWRFQAIFDAINESVFLHDKLSGEILLVNQIACKMYGYTQEEMLKLTVGDLSEGIPPFSQADGLERIHNATKDQAQLFEWRAKRKNGELFWVEINIKTATIGNDEYVLVSVRDIGERKTSERSSQALYELAERSVTADNLDDFYREIHRIIGDLIPAKNFYIAVYDSNNDLLNVPYYQDQFDPKPPPHHPESGLTTYVLRTGKPLLLKREEHLQQRAEGIDSIGTPAVDWLGVPLMTNQGVIGVMAVQTYDMKERLTESDRELLIFVSNQVAMTIQRRRAEEYQHDLSRSLQAVFGAANELLQIDDMDMFYRRMVELGREKIGLERCGFFLLDPSQEFLTGTYGTDAEGNTTDEHSARLPTADMPEIFKPPDIPYTLLTDFPQRGNTYWDGNRKVIIGHGWIAATVIRNSIAPLGILYNDSAISDSEFNPAIQEATTVYCSLLGSIIDRKSLENFEKKSIERLNGLIEAADELLTYTDLDIFYKRAVELAREKLRIERCAISLIDPTDNKLYGTFGTDDQGMTTDERGTSWSVDNLQQLFNSQRMHWTILEQDFGYWKDQKYISTQKRGWIAQTLIRIRDEPVGLFTNDSAITQSAPDGMLQETIHLYCSLLGNLLHRLQGEHERQELIAELSSKNAELERFTYTVSHDLKAPLITIRGFLGFLEKDAQSGNTNRLNADINRITHATDKMQQLLDDLLELSRIGRIGGPPQAIQFREVIDEALERLRGPLTQNQVKVDVTNEFPVVYGDRARLIEVVQNLIENSIKFMGSQTSPQITIGVRRQKEEEPMIFFVKDNGIGIDPQYHERIFDLFDKLDAQSEGTGIGLALVRRIIEFHGGRIWVESDGSGTGAIFCFTLSEIKPP